jgi:hypothetical protein
VGEFISSHVAKASVGLAVPPCPEYFCHRVLLETFSVALPYEKAIPLEPFANHDAVFTELLYRH